MAKLKEILAGKVLLILAFAAILGYVDTQTDLKLGLDLQGGTQLDYQIDLSKVDEADQDQIVEGVKEVIRRRVDSLGVSEPQIYTSNIADEYHVIVELAGISDIEEAKAVVGKTIQLEFREQSTETSQEKIDWANESAQAYYNKLSQGGDFISLSEEEEKQYADAIFWVNQPLQDIRNYSDEMQVAIEGKAIGTVLAPFKISDGVTLAKSGQLMPLDGVAVVQIVDKTTSQEEVTPDLKVSARHILVSYEGAQSSSQTRTKDEALALIQEVKSKLDTGGNFEDLAKEYSEDGTSEKGGDLGEFGKGAMVAPFEEAAFALEPDQISEVVETDYGFHLIQVYNKTGGVPEMQTITKVQLNKMIFLTTPDPWAEAILTGKHFKHADVAFDETTYQPYVAIAFNDEGAKIFEDLTGRNVGNQIAIFVGGDMVSSPTVQTQIAGGFAQITGDFTLDEASDLARELNTGAIPAPITLAGQYTISSTLGADALKESVYAGIVGLIILAIYLLLYYRLPGLLADIALAIYSVLLLFFIKSAIPTAAAVIIGLAAFAYIVHAIIQNRDSGGEKFISFILACIVLFFLTFVLSNKITLTLAGVAGVILSIGMAVDANVLIFERMKEELASGKSLRESIQEGFDRAWDSIRDSNFSSLITCAILFYFGTSIIRGFALNLALGILISMFSAITISKTLLLFSSETSAEKNLWLFNKPKKAFKEKFQIIKTSRIWAALSGTLVTASIIASLVFGLNLGLDFTGGTMLELNINSTDPISAESLADTILLVEEEQAAEFGIPQVVKTDQGTYIFRLKHISETEHDAIMSKFKEIYPSVEEVRFTTVGPVIGKTLKNKAITALVITLFMIVFYIAFAFRKIPKEVSPWRFGICAITALVHDILIVLGVFVILGKYMGVEIDALFITALLTIMGFSVHDTIVVFDRVRENLNFRKHGETLSETTNRALNQTMARSMNTSISTLITIVALLVLGADSIRMFVLALTIGIIVGTYSSIFVASPLLVWWNNKATKSN
ncbi:protein translocase subunit SecF [Patescibacteria group bacterium]|nr:protein translocase subunit SecF [Patescibacteria group bacterium]